MRKPALIIMLGLSMLACSVSDITRLIPGMPISPLPTAFPIETVYVTSTSTPSIMPTQPTPTFTPTPTLIYLGSMGSPSDTPIPTGTLWTVGQAVSSPNSVTPNSNTPEASGFSSYSMSGNILHWGVCPLNKIQVVARPSDVTHTHFVLLFLRLQDRESPFEATHWGSGAIMDSDGKGTFTYTLTAENLPGYREFTLAWVQYQFVATDKKLNVIGRTQVVLNSIAYSPCS